MDGIFLVLEPANHIYQVIEAAHRKGLTVVVCHSQPVRPPPPFERALACISAVVPVPGWKDSQLAFDRIVEWCGPKVVRGTYAGFEVTLRTEAMLRRRYGLPGSDPGKVQTLLDKAAVRGTLRRSSLTRLRHVEGPELRSMSRWPFPGHAAFLKPATGSGSVYVRRCSSVADVHEHVAEWDSRARHIPTNVADHLAAGPGLFLEEEAVGELLSVEGYCFGGRYTAVGITDRTVLARDIAVEMGNTFPCPHPRLEEIAAKTSTIHRCLGIDHGATHVELIVPSQGEIELVEINPRFAGGDILTLIDRAFDIRFEDELVALAIGQPPADLVPPRPIRYVSGQDFLAPAHVHRFESIEIPGEDVFFRKVVVKPGTELKSTNFQSDHVAAFAVDAQTYPGAIARANAIRSLATINGESLANDPNNVVINLAERWLSPKESS